MIKKYNLSGNLEALKVLIKYGKNIDFAITDNKGNTSLHHAAKTGNLVILELLSSKFVSYIFKEMRIIPNSLI